jgi:cytochrome c-type protein NapB
MRRLVLVSLCALLAGACANSRPVPSAAPPAAGVPDRDLGLVKESVFDVPTPPAVKANDTMPGELPLLPRAYAIAPPRVPHAVADFLPITRAQNACLDCHAVKEKKAGEPTPMPPSHYVDERNAPGRVAEQPAGARYVCVSCHVAKTDAPDLVENRFRR